MYREGLVMIKTEPRLPSVLNQAYKTVEIRGVSRLVLSEDALEYKRDMEIRAFQALTKEFPVINGPGGGEYMLEMNCAPM